MINMLNKCHLAIILVLLLSLVLISSCTQKKVLQEAEVIVPTSLPSESSAADIAADIDNKNLETLEVPEKSEKTVLPAEPVVKEILKVPEVIDESDLEPEPEVVEKGSSLIAHWKFDEEGDVIKDSANDYDGTIKGGATFKSGKLGKALYFDGVDDYVEFSSIAVDKLGTLSQGTIAFWFKFDSLLDQQTVMPMFYFGGANRPDNIYVIEIGHSAGSETLDFNVDPWTPDPENTRV